MASLKEIAILDYFSKIDFKKDDWKLSKIKEDLRNFLGESPAIDVIYKKDVMVNEVSGESKEFVDVDKVKVVFFDTDEKFKKLEFIVSNKI
jgi:hypothetical protein